jgi:hypothetical protein
MNQIIYTYSVSSETKTKDGRLLLHVEMLPYLASLEEEQGQNRDLAMDFPSHP